MLAHQFSPAELVILVAVTVGAITDLTTKKIYNWITYPTAVAGIIINGIQGYIGAGGSGAAWAIFWAMVGCLLGVFLTAGPRAFTAKDFVHPGDVKIWGAVGTCLLPLKMFICWLCFSVIYGAVAAFLIAKAIERDQIKGLWLQLKTFLTACAGGPTTGDTTEVEAARKALIPLCPAIAIGTYLGIVFDKPLMQFMGFKWY